MNNIYKHFTIKELSKSDRPREKMLEHGKQVLSNAELIAILIGSGSRTESAVSLAQRILKSVNDDLNELGKLSLSQLMKFKGIGEAKAVSILASLELGRRRQLKDVTIDPKVSSSQDAYQYIGPQLIDLEVEQFWIILLSRSNNIIAKRKISEGGVAGTVVDAKVVFKYAIDQLASSIILVHNHPSGNLNPSQQDKVLTKKLVDAGNLLSIKVIDHLIVSNRGYISFADEGWI
jgi:DNA repair protein RadC